MPVKKKKKPIPFINVALFLDDHAKLKELAQREQRSMARQLSVILKKAYADAKVPDKI
tara:strand:- start:268 stop:441 length:174 start_codon:yes stop_codon:yes gene_type:complete